MMCKAACNMCISSKLYNTIYEAVVFYLSGRNWKNSWRRRRKVLEPWLTLRTKWMMYVCDCINGFKSASHYLSARSAAKAPFFQTYSICCFRNGEKNWQKTGRSYWVEATKTRSHQTKRRRRRTRKKYVLLLWYVNSDYYVTFFTKFASICLKKRKREKKKSNRVRRSLQYFHGQLSLFSGCTHKLFSCFSIGPVC